MGKTLKIIGISFLALMLVIGAIVFILYQNFKWIGDAEDLGIAFIGSPPFNEKLVSCSPSLGTSSGSFITDSWEIRGLSAGKCVVAHYKPIEETLEEDIQQGQVRYEGYTCKLPQEVYSKPENIRWSKLIDSEYCAKFE